MRLKIIVLTLAISGIIVLSLFGFNVKERAIRGMVADVSEYNCDASNLCTSCIINGNTCSCGKSTCSCGNETVNKAECELYS